MYVADETAQQAKLRLLRAAASCAAGHDCTPEQISAAVAAGIEEDAEIRKLKNRGHLTVVPEPAAAAPGSGLAALLAQAQAAA